LLTADVLLETEDERTDEERDEDWAEDEFREEADELDCTLNDEAVLDREDALDCDDPPELCELFELFDDELPEVVELCELPDLDEEERLPVHAEGSHRYSISRPPPVPYTHTLS
jgi:hypothetical protein